MSKIVFAALAVLGTMVLVRAVLSKPLSQTQMQTVVIETNAGPIEIGYILRPASLHKMPSAVDSNSPVFWDDGNMFMFNSEAHPFYSWGESLESLSEPMAVEIINPSVRPGFYWLEAIWKDDQTGTLYGWYHFEPHDLPCLTAPLIGPAISFDNGLTWEDQGFVLENGYEIDCSYDIRFFTGGNGDFSVILNSEQQYFYFLFSNYGGPVSEQGIAIARSSFEDRGQPGTVWKYFNGSWEEPGLEGRVSPIFGTKTGWKGPAIDAFWGSSVHFNAHLGVYVVLLNRAVDREWTQEGIYIAFSSDLIQWTEPQKLLDKGDFYPQIIGLGPRETDTLVGQYGRLYVHGESRWIIEFIIVGATPRYSPRY